MIIDQGCQTNAPEAKLFVSSEPEYFYGNLLLENTEGLCEEYQSFINKLSRAAAIAGFSRFRCYGEIRQSGEHCMVMVSEFRSWKDDDEFWKQLQTVIDLTEAHVWVMEDRKENQHYGSYTDEEGYHVRDSYGPNHDREYLQVELSWRIEKMNYRQIEAFAERLTAATEQVWEESGVGVC